jgi:hypothetical protein
LPFKLNQAGRHHIPRQKHKGTNWPAYDASLRQRGCLTVWFTDEAITAGSRTAHHPGRTTLVLDRDHHFVQVPLARWSWPQPAQVAGEGRTELQNPAPDGFVRGLDAALSQELLDIAVADCPF